MSHDNDNNDDLTMQNNYQNDEYALSGKILKIAIIILFALVVVILMLNLFARWRINRARRQELRRRDRLNRRTQLFFYVNNNINRVPGSATLVVANQGLEPEVLNSLPVFLYDSSKEGVVEATLECAVCLSEFEDDDKGRVLPKCGHIFHAECVDMWFHAHATCPLCRSNVELVKESEMCDELVNGDDMGGNLGRGNDGTTLDESPVKGLEGSRRTRLEVELEPSPIIACPGQGHVYISPKSRRLSLRRLLSINRKTTPVDVTITSYGVGTSSNTSMEIETDLETGITLPELIA